MMTLLLPDQPLPLPIVYALPLLPGRRCLVPNSHLGAFIHRPTTPRLPSRIPEIHLVLGSHLRQGL
jgi:hypothetical protein